MNDTKRKRRYDTESANTPPRPRHNSRNRILGGDPIRKGPSRFSIPLIIAMLMSFVSVLGMSANAATLPTALVNGNFEYPGYSVLNSTMSAGGEDALDWYIDVNGGKLINTGKYSQPWAAIPNWNKSTFGWLSTQPRCDWGYGTTNQIVPAQTVQINVDNKTRNSFAELTIHTKSAIYQDLSTTPGSIYTWSLRHAPYDRRTDTMSVMIGSPSKQTAQDATRETVNGNGDQVGFVGKVIATKGATDDAHDLSNQWETYTGTYKIPDGQTTTRFTFATASASSEDMSGNNLDNIVFDIAYPVTFDDNGGTGGPKSSYKDPNGVYQRYYHDGASIKAETDPTRSGYTFLGWSETKLGSITSQEQLQEQRDKIIKHDALKMAAPGKTFYAVWGKNPTLTFDKNFTGSPLVQLPEQQTVKFGGSATRPTTWTSTANSIRKGYSFTGWKTSASSSADYAFSALFSDTTVYAGWSANSYTIRFAGNGATGGSTASMSMRYDETRALNRNGFTYTGKTFAGWNTQPGGGGTSYSDGQSVKNLVESNGGEITLYAQWGTNVYTVTFMDGKTGGKISTATANYGSSVTPPSYPPHTGYTPTGWDKDTSRVTQNMTVTVNYRPNKYTIRFDGNASGVSGSMSDMQMEYDKSKNLTSNAFSLSGHSWLNWNTAAAGNAKSYSNGQSVKNLTETDGGIVTLYAQWSTNAYTVTFVDGKTGRNISNVSVDYGGAVTPPAYPTHPGYTPTGWDKSTANVTQNMTVTVNYRPNRYKIHFDGNATGVTGNMTDMDMEYDKAKNLTTNAYTLDGHSWLSWNTAANGSGKTYSNGQSVKNLTETDGGTVTLYAQWSTNAYTVTFIDGHDGKTIKQESVKYGGAATAPDAPKHEGYTSTHWDKRFDNVTSNITVTLEYIANEYVINFDGNGATSGNMQPLQMQYDKEKNLTANAFAREGYTWAGWNTKAGGSGTGYTDKQTVRNLTSESNGSVTLYAQWTPIAYRIQFNKNLTDATGETASMEMTFDVTKNLTTNGFTSPSAKFNCWNSKPDGSGQAYANEQSVKNLTKAPNDVVTLYAQWNTNSYTVTFVDGHDGKTISTPSVKYGGSAIPPTKPVHEGYTATTWDGNYQNVKHDETVTLQYRPNAYEIAFKANGGTGTMGDQQMKYDTPAKLTANAYKKTGYTFTGWRQDDKATGTKYRNRETVTNLLSANGATTTMYAQWKANEYTVTFIDGHDGKTIGTETVTHGSNATEPNKPSHEGYTATTWDKPLSNITGDTVITLAYRPNAYTIRFDKNAANATGSTADKHMEYDKSGNLTRNGYSRTGYTWLGWSSSADGNGTMYSDGQSVVNLTSEDGGTVTLYAVWKINRYTVTFIDGKTGDVIGRQEVDYGSDASFPSEPSHAGYKPSGWNSNGKNITKDTTITLSYQPVSYQIAFDGNAQDVTGTMQNQRMAYNTASNLTRNSFARSGYTFVGWNSDSNANGRQYTDGQSVINLTSTDGGIVTMYAQWIENEHVAITYKIETDDGAEDDGNAISNALDDLNPDTGIAKGSKATASDAYSFTGWYDETGKLVSKDAEYIPSKPETGRWANAVYTAKFARKEFKVRFLDKEGKLIKEETVKYGAGATAPDAPSVDGYEFSGWDRAFDNVTEDIDVTALYRELPKPVEPAPPIGKPQQPQDDGIANDLVQTGIELVPFLAPLLVSLIAAIALVKRIRRR